MSLQSQGKMTKAFVLSILGKNRRCLIFKAEHSFVNGGQYIVIVKGAISIKREKVYVQAR
jgi:hypothetical protein